MSKPIPFLTVEERVAYLYDRGYFPTGTFTESHHEQLEHLNFHYFLGYARNYRMLVGRGLIARTEKSPDDVFTIIKQDHHVAELLYSGVRRAEWALRRLAVERYCNQFEPTRTFLDPNRYSETYDGSSRRLVEQMLDQILRYGEPYVSGHIDTVSRITGVPRHKSYSVEHHKACATLVKDLPLWAVVDCFSLGLLSRFITQCHSPETSKSPVWKAVAHDLDIPAQLFPTHIESLAVLRNLVAHHTRLWMRPTTSSPRKPKRYEKVLRGTGLPPEVGPRVMRAAVSSMGTDFSILSRAAVPER